VNSRLILSFPHLLHATKRRLRDLVKPDNYALSANTMVDLTRSKKELILENAFLRQQLIILDRQVKRPLAKPRERVLLVVLASRLWVWNQALLIVQPDTLLRWHRHLYRVVGEYVSYFNNARPHQGLNQKIPCGRGCPSGEGKIVALPVLGELHHDYRRAA
jgi:hypothetical protein